MASISRSRGSSAYATTIISSTMTMTPCSPNGSRCTQFAATMGNSEPASPASANMPRPRPNT